MSNHFPRTVSDQRTPAAVLAAVLVATLPGLPSIPAAKADVAQWMPCPSLGEAWRRFTLEVGGARNWYFYVPKGVETFRVRAAARLETDVVHLEINVPDRTLAMIYDHQAEKTVHVPPFGVPHRVPAAMVRRHAQREHARAAGAVVPALAVQHRSRGVDGDAALRAPRPAAEAGVSTLRSLSLKVVALRGPRRSAFGVGTSEDTVSPARGPGRPAT